MIQARPVGIPSLYYWANGAIGKAVSHGRWRHAAKLLVDSALCGDEGAVAAEGGKDVGDGSSEGWGAWSEVDGVCEVSIEEVGTQSSFSVGAAQKGFGAYRAAGSRKLYVDVVADATTGISKVRCVVPCCGLCAAWNAALLGVCDVVCGTACSRHGHAHRSCSARSVHPQSPGGA